MEATTHSEVGKARDHNEDSVLATTIGEASLLAVADGMGGHSAGDIASEAALNQFCKSVRELLGSGADEESVLKTAVSEANDHLQSIIAENPEYEGMGTTLVGALITEVSGDDNETNTDSDALEATYVNVGDSRGYHVTDSEIEQVTVDHSLVQELVEKEQITLEEAETHPQRNVVSQALGTDGVVEPDCFRRSLSGTVLLCSDGLTEELSESEIHEILVADLSLLERGEMLVERANERGGSDNISVVLGERNSDLTKPSS